MGWAAQKLWLDNGRWRLRCVFGAGGLVGLHRNGLGLGRGSEPQWGTIPSSSLATFVSAWVHKNHPEAVDSHAGWELQLASTEYGTYFSSLARYDSVNIKSMTTVIQFNCIS